MWPSGTAATGWCSPKVYLSRVIAPYTSELRFERQAPVLVEHQRTDRAHDLRHRGELEDRVERHLRAGFLVEVTVGLVVHELAVARDGDHGAGHAVGFDLAGEERVDARQPLLRESRGLRGNGWQGLGKCTDGTQSNGDCGGNLAHGVSSRGFAGCEQTGVCGLAQALCARAGADNSVRGVALRYPTDWAGEAYSRSGNGFTGVPFHHFASGPSSRIAKCRWGAVGLALPVVPT